MKYKHFNGMANLCSLPFSTNYVHMAHCTMDTIYTLHTLHRVNTVHCTCFTQYSVHSTHCVYSYLPTALSVAIGDVVYRNGPHQCTMAQCREECRAVLCSEELCSLVQFNIVQFSARQCHISQCSDVQCVLFSASL